jgi:integrase/recombinase XerD
LKTIILLAAHAGFRRSDCLRIAPVHWNPIGRTITIAQQKTGQQITVPLSDKLTSWFEHTPEGDTATPFYQLHRGTPITPAGLNSAFAAARRRAKVNDQLTLHDLRRTLAVSLYEVSKDLRVVEQMLGHTSLGSTVHYLEHRDPAKLRPYLAALCKPAPKAVQ